MTTFLVESQFYLESDRHTRKSKELVADAKPTVYASFSQVLFRCNCSSWRYEDGNYNEQAQN
jgi:hypothetical protein